MCSRQTNPFAKSEDFIK